MNELPFDTQAEALPLIQVRFEGIDQLNRPIFKEVGKARRFGSCDKLFQFEACERHVLKKVTAKDLVYFGTSFGCEPQGFTCNCNIITGA